VDPTLRRLVEAGAPTDEVSVMVRLAVPAVLPAGVRVVSQFGDIATVRVARGEVEALRAAQDVQSVKASRLYRPELVGVAGEDVGVTEADERRPADGPTGRGVLVGLVDWGLDLDHPAMRRADGRTRVAALWDQTAAGRPNRYGYGAIHTRAAIDAALATGDAGRALGYDVRAWDVGGGTHGTATTSIAAGSSWPGGTSGMAPDADIAFVNLAGAEALGHSVAIGEAIDFVARVAGDRPWVVNLSLGRHGGPHDGCLLTERLLDAAALQRPGALIVNSAGNYFAARTHAHMRVRDGDVAAFPIAIADRARDLHEIDIWYRAIDRILVGIVAPGGERSALARAGGDIAFTLGGAPVARIQHRSDDPTNGASNAVVRIDPVAPGGIWQLLVIGADVRDGRVHAWIEREALKPGTQARFGPADAVATTTTGTICNGLQNVAVGAYDPHDPARPPARFSSSGETVDGRPKPDILAPGVDILVARSGSGDDDELSTRMSGTSMAAPFVTGTAACMLEVAGRVPGPQLRAALLAAAEPFEGDQEFRAGHGYLDFAAAVEAVRRPRAVIRNRRRSGA
jgi:subtilisin family serine protease